MRKAKTINAEKEELKAAPAPEFPPNQPLDRGDKSQSAIALKESCPEHEPACGARATLSARSDPGASVLCYLVRAVAVLLLVALPAGAQVLLNVDFGVGSQSPKIGFAATGQATNDFWNLYRHYDPKFVPGMPLVANGEMKGLKFADGTASKVVLAVTNAPGVWGNASGDPMFDTYVFAQNGSNITVTLRGLEPGRYHFYIYGHADPDVTGEQNSVFTLHSGTNRLGPVTTASSNGWKATSPWQERYQYVVLRDVPVLDGESVFIEVAPGANGVAVLNGLQIISRGTSPPLLVTPAIVKPPSVFTNLLVHEIRYDGKVGDSDARFRVTLDLESLTTNEISRALFEGDVALIAPEIPTGLRIVSGAKQYRLFCSAPGRYQLNFELVAKISKAEPWNQVSFLGPMAAIASVTAAADSPGVEMQLLSGTQLEPEAKAASRISGFLGPDRRLSLRWQGRTTEITRKSLVTVDTLATAQITPTVIKYQTQFRYEILQAPVSKLVISVPAAHALTRVQGEQIRDWSLKPDGDHQALTIEFVKPVEKSYALMLFTEQPVETTSLTAQFGVPQPLNIERESGTFTVSADDMVAEIDSATGLRQVNAAAAALAAYRFYGRPIALAARLKRIEPVLNVDDRVTTRLEETRLLVAHELTLNVQKAGIYTLELTPQTNFVVADVRGEGIDDWKFADGRLRVSFSRQILGVHRLDVHLEQPLKTFPDQFAVTPLRATGATNETASIGAAAALGIRLKTAGALTGLREIPVSSLSSPSDETLAFSADQPDWALTLAAERLPARVVADIFNLITIGDGLVGGSAVVRYGIINQGVQEFRLRLPAHWKNAEFTGPNIRSKELLTNAAPAGATSDTNSVLWSIALQEKAWGGYTLVVTYDYQFDPKQAALNLAGAHAVGVERETGSLAIANAAALQLKARAAAEPLRLIDQTELAETDRALITRPVLLAYRYTGDSYALVADVVRNQEAQGLLNAVADRTQVTSVITEEGQMLSQASFMVKNNDKQFQRFQLPRGATLWGCYVNNNPVKAEQDGDWLMVSLPRGANRDEAFAVDIVYKQTLDSFKGGLVPRGLALAAPKTDVPNTYAEWQLYVPTSQRLSSFGGSMTVQRGTTYTLRDGWNRFLQYYSEVFRDYGAAMILWGGGATLFLALIGAALRKGGRGFVTVLGLFVILALMAGMLLPALSKAKSKAQRISAVNNLKQIGLAARMFANDNSGRLPNGFEEMMAELSTDKVLRDPQTGERFVYVGAGKRADDPRMILAYSPVDVNGRAVAFADGSVQQMSSAQFAEAMQRDAEAVRQPAMPPLDTAQLGAVRQLQGDVGVNTRYYANGATASKPGTPNLMVDAATGLPTASPESPSRPSAIAAGRGGAGGAGVMLGQAGLPALQPASAAGAATTAAALAPVISGLRSIRIDIPRTGQAFTFTKVLNVTDEALSVKMSVMKVNAFRVMRSALQLACFVAGLLLVWREWRRTPSRSLRLTLGLALAIGAVISLGVAARALHTLLILAVPALLLVLVLWLGWRLWSHRPLTPTPASAPDHGPQRTDNTGPAPSSAAAVIAILLSLSIGLAASARAEDSESDQSINNNHQPTITNTVSLVSASYTGRVRDRVAQFDVTLMVSTIATNQTIPLFGEDAAIESFSTDAKGAMLLRQSRGVALRLAEKGNATVKLKLAVKLGGDVTKRQLSFAIPPALSSKLDLSLDEPEADVEFPTAVAFKRTTDREQTRIDAILGAGDRVDLNWTPRMKRIGDMAASIFAQNTTLVTVGGGAVNTRSVLDYQISQGELRQVKVRLPAGQRLLRVEGEWIRTWELSGDGAAQILAVDLLKGVSPGYRLTLETEKVLDKLPATVAAEVPHAQDVIRETGLVGLRGGEELSLTIDRAQDVQRIDAAEFARGGAFKPDSIVGAYRFLKPWFQLTARAEAIQPEVEAVVRNNLHVGFEQVSINARVDYSIKKAGVFNLRLAVPAGYKIDSITGTNIAQWNERPADNMVEVRLRERILGAYTLQLALTKAQKDLPKTIEGAGVRPIDVQKLTGFVSATAEPGVAVKATAFDGLTEIPAAALGEGRTGASVLAYKLLGTDPQQAGAWKLTLATETVESWIRAEVVNVISLTETLVSGRSIVRYDIQNAPVKEFRLRVPAAFTNIDISGANIRQRDRTGEVWRIELQNKVRGTYSLTVSWEQSRTATTNNTGVLLAFNGVETAGIERETGTIVLLSKPALQVAEKSLSEQLIKIDVREVPAWAGVSPTAVSPGGEMPVLAFRYLRPGYALGIETRRFDEAALLQALVDSARFTTVVADDGQMMTEMALSIRNNGLQFLEVELPQKAQVWSAFVAGQPVRPTTRGTQLLLPLERSASDDAPVSVELIYVTQDVFPRTKGKVDLASPKLDVPLKNARWDVYLPPDYDYAKFAGSMAHTAEDAEPAVQVYSSLDYRKQEQEKKVAQKSELFGFLTNARRSLAEGKFKAANEEFNNAVRLNRDGVDGDALRELDDLKKELSKTQSGNLLQAQRAYTEQNLKRIGGKDDSALANASVEQLERAGKLVNYDTEAAERQWGALQRAQEVTVAKVQPLRANLPTRGVRLSFSQALQTEVNKPMTIEFSAANVRHVGWFAQGLYGISSFLLLWVLVGLLNARRTARPARSV